MTIDGVASQILGMFKKRGLRAGDALHYTDLESAIVIAGYTRAGVGAVPEALRVLEARGFIEEREHHTFHLTHAGQEVIDYVWTPWWEFTRPA